ncbi:MAG: 3-deoxy-7-phosphoheptulonate synthase [Cytophagales bacterium]|nr:3-deoxy-7-phosphoheptulonate synthase [Cytophagales bacterium]
MVVHVDGKVGEDLLAEWGRKYFAVFFREGDKYVGVLAAELKTLPKEIEPWVRDIYPTSSNIQLASREYKDELRLIRLGTDIEIGGSSSRTLMIAGPCSVESEEQIDQTAHFMKEIGVRIIRAGCYKPRTSPYAFQGSGKKGLEWLVAAGKKYGLKVITEVRDATHFDEVADLSDIIQVGAKAMYDQGILRGCGRSRKPVLIKRGFGSTLQEFVQAAEFVLSGGNTQVMLCERGIRSFETKTRFTLDLCGVAYLKYHTNLPIIVDPSHAMGAAYGVSDLSAAALAMGVDGLLIEVHPCPSRALSDAAQQLDFQSFRSLYKRLDSLAQAVSRPLL